jgi:hypothetical protein
VACLALETVSLILMVVTLAKRDREIPQYSLWLMLELAVVVVEEVVVVRG